MAEHRRRVTAMLRRAQIFEERIRFVRNEVRSAPRTAAYTLRASSLVACYRHHSADMGALADIFVDDEYVLPEPIAAYLTSRSAPRILDLGGHVGYFGLYAFGMFPRASVVTYEPDPSNAAVLTRCVALNPDLAGRWDVRRAAAAASEGTVAFVADGTTGSHIEADDGSADTIAVPAVDVLPELPAYDLVKLDVEGGEWEILHDPRFADHAPAVLALEYHSRGSRTGAPAAEARAVMAAGGYRVIPVVEKRDDMGTLWGLKERA
jgi:FkbM family methyltransferase